VAYVTTTLPYILIVVVLVRGVTLDGAMNGVTYYIIPDLKKLGELEVCSGKGQTTSIPFFVCPCLSMDSNEIFILWKKTTFMNLDMNNDCKTNGIMT